MAAIEITEILQYIVDNALGGTLIGLAIIFAVFAYIMFRMGIPMNAALMLGVILLFGFTLITAEVWGALFYWVLIGIFALVGLGIIMILRK